MQNRSGMAWYFKTGEMSMCYFQACIWELVKPFLIILFTDPPSHDVYWRLRENDFAFFFKGNTSAYWKKMRMLPDALKKYVNYLELETAWKKIYVYAFGHTDGFTKENST